MLAFFIVSIVSSRVVAEVARPLETLGIPVSDIFSGTDTPGSSPEYDDVSPETTSTFLIGLLASVFVIIGAGRTYAEHYKKCITEFNNAKGKYRRTIEGGVVVHDQNVVALLSRMNGLKSEQINLERELQMLRKGG